MKKNGFSLIEILVAISILGGLSLLTMKIFNIQLGTQKASDINEDMVIMSSQIIAFLNDKESCTLSLNKVQIAAGSKKNSTPINLLQTANGKKIIEKNQMFNNSEIFIKDITIDTKDDNPFLASSKHHIYQAELIVEIEKRPKGSPTINPPGAKNITKKYPLLLDFSLHQAYSMFANLKISEGYVKEKLFNQCKNNYNAANFVGHEIYKVFCNNKDESLTQKVCLGMCQVKNTSDIRITRCL